MGGDRGEAALAHEPAAEGVTSPPMAAVLFAGRATFYKPKSYAQE
jgi:hypothetical protein